MVHLFIAHGPETGVHLHGSRTPWVIAVIAVAVLLLAAIAFLAWLWERRFQYWMEKGKRSRHEEFQSWIRGRRVLYSVAAVLVVAGASTATVLIRSSESSVSAGPPPVTSNPTPGDPYPMVFQETTAEGAFEAEVSNLTDRDEFLQCFVDAFDTEGGSVLTGTYDAVAPDGSGFESDAYSPRFELPAGATNTISARLRVDGVVARIEGACVKIPPPPPTATPSP